MKLSPIFLATILLSLIWGRNPVQAQEPQNWQSFKQTFSNPRFPQEYCKYSHAVTLSQGKFVADATRDLSGEAFYTSLLTFDLADLDSAKMRIVKGNQGYAPDLWYLYIPVKNPNHAKPRVLATPQTDRSHLIVKSEVQTYNNKRIEQTWILTEMFLNFDNQAAAMQAAADIAAAHP